MVLGNERSDEGDSNENFVKKVIHHFHIDHNGPCLPPKILRSHCFQFLLGITVIPRETKDNGYAKSWWVNKMLYGLCKTGE